MQEHIKHAPIDASPSADILSASRGFSGPYTHIKMNHGVGKVSLEELGLVMPTYAWNMRWEDAPRAGWGPGWIWGVVLSTWTHSPVMGGPWGCLGVGLLLIE